MFYFCLCFTEVCFFFSFEDCFVVLLSSLLFIYPYAVYLSLCCLFIPMLFIYPYAVYLSLCCLFILMLFIYPYAVYLSLCCLFIPMLFIYPYAVYLSISCFKLLIVARRHATGTYAIMILALLIG